MWYSFWFIGILLMRSLSILVLAWLGPYLENQRMQA